MSSTVAEILRRAVEGRRLGFDEGVELFRSASLLELGRAADAVCRRLHPEPYRTYNIDRNINYTNVCAAVCDFCAFYRKVGRHRRLRPGPRRAAREDPRDRRAGRRPDPHAGRSASGPRARVVRGPASRHQVALPPGQRARLQRAGDLFPHEGGQEAAAGGPGAAQGRGAGEPARRRGGDPGRPRPQGDHAGQGHDRQLARRPSRLAPARRAVDGHDDVRPRRDDRGAGRALRAGAATPGRDRRLHGVHLLDVPARPYRHGGRSPGRGLRVPQDPGDLAALPGQHPEHPVVVGHAGAQDRPGRAPLRRERHGEPDDRGERRLVGRHGVSPLARGNPPRDPRVRLHPPPA